MGKAIVIHGDKWARMSNRLDKAEKLLNKILPMAMWESCQYKNDPDADPTTHCCDWNEIVDSILEIMDDD